LDSVVEELGAFEKLILTCFSNFLCFYTVISPYLGLDLLQFFTWALGGQSSQVVMPLTPTQRKKPDNSYEKNNSKQTRLNYTPNKVRKERN
jgi:hypothetical protein